MRVLFVDSEAHPLVKTGGLADVCGALPPALRAIGIDVRMLIPAYRQILERVRDVRVVGEIPARFGYPAARLLEPAPPGDDTIWLLDCPQLYDRDGGIYAGPSGDWPDNHLRFGLLGHVAAEIGKDARGTAWTPDIVHCHDWQAALAPAYLALWPGARPRTLLTIHNLAFQGIFDPSVIDALGLPRASYSIEGIEFYGRLSFLKAGLFYADRISTVSPTYAEEIQHEPLGFGMHGLLARRRAQLVGILNGIDDREWDPAHDPHLPAQYDAGHLEGKASAKAGLLHEMGLPADGRPLIGAVGRLTHQKGADLIPAALRPWLADGVQYVLLGSGDSALEGQMRALAAEFPRSVAVRIGYDEGLAHRIEAGADMFLMPSRFEPCGLNQMYSQRYGTPPIVRSTGGLADSVIDPGEALESIDRATGFSFIEPSVGALVHTLGRALATWRNGPAWRRMQRNGMQRDFGWQASAARYADLYRDMLA